VSAGLQAQNLGRAWESHAARYLEARGLKIIARGYRCRLGELDIIGSDAAGLVVVEVRARRRGRFGSALETVGPHKQRRIVLATRHYLMHHPEWLSRPIRFDVVAIDDIDGAKPRVRWVRSAFDAA